MNPPVSLAQTMMDAIRAGTPDAVPLTDDAVMWHNYDPTEVPAAQAAANLAAIQAVLPDCRFEEVRAHGTGAVSVAQYVFTATLPDGSCLRAPGCFVVHERDGRIARIEEYMDSAQLAPIAAAIATLAEGSAS
jgi:ketosteroid isomerase-like protein